ncbi:MAG: hypothetical protein LBS98_05055 [Coriobacteriales bacterium]|jgi:nitrogenase molybdenum-iron protein alpha chain|nr:hypothetical protein [Coriobacteriales bacterium]
MTINLKVSQVPPREQRLGSVTGYAGDLQDLVSQARCGSLESRDRCFKQTSTCVSCALFGLTTIKDVAVVNHAPAGCSAIGIGVQVMNRQLAARRGTTNNSVIIGTGMDEADTVFGATDSLKEIILQVYERYHPRAIFIGTSCVTGIIGEDIDSVADELSQELPVPVKPVHCEGFRTHIWIGGQDVVGHTVLNTFVKPPKVKTNKINFINFFESARDEIIETFGKFGLEPVFLMVNSTVEELEHLSEAICTTSMCGTLGTYLGNALEQEYGVPYVRTLNPSGVTGYETFLREIGRVTGRSEPIEEHIAEQRELYINQIEELKKKLKGLRVVIGMGPGYALEIARVVDELGMEVVWNTSWHFDTNYDNGEVPPAAAYLADKGLNFGMSVSDQQNYELLNVINTYKPDLYLSRHTGTTVWAIKQGVPALCVADEYMIYGHKRVLEFGQAVLDTINNRSFEVNLARRTKLPYTDWWYQQKPTALLREVTV